MPSDSCGSVIISQADPRANQTSTDVQSLVKKKPNPATFTKFYKGEPEVLGVTQIFIGSITIALGITLKLNCENSWSCFSMVLLYYTGLPFWTGIMYIVSGSLSVAASYKPTLGMIKSILVFNIFSSIAAGIGIIILAIQVEYLHGRRQRYSAFCYVYESTNICEGAFYPEIAVSGMTTLLFILCLLEFCITISCSVFGCKVACRSSINEVTVVIYQSGAPNAGDSAAATVSALVP